MLPTGAVVKHSKDSITIFCCNINIVRVGDYERKRFLYHFYSSSILPFLLFGSTSRLNFPDFFFRDYSSLSAILNGGLIMVGSRKRK